MVSNKFMTVLRTDVESTMLNNLCPKNLCNKTFSMNVTMHQIAYSQIETLSKGSYNGLDIDVD